MPYDTKLGHAEPKKIEAKINGQSEKKQEFVRKAMDLFREFANDSRIIRNKCRDNDARYWDSYRLYRDKNGVDGALAQEMSCAPSYDYNADKNGLTHYPVATPALYSVCESMIADLVGSFPEPVLLGRSAGDDVIADTISAMLRMQREQGNYRREYRATVKRIVRRGVDVVECVWDPDASFGRGDVRINEVDFLYFYPDPMYEDIQDGRACFKLVWRHRGWYQERYPKLYPMMQDEQELSAERAGSEVYTRNDDGQIALLEYWYRKYDEKSGAYRIHMAKIAGGVVLECSEESTPHGMYGHGRYPFVMRYFQPMDGTPWGMGMVDLFGQMQDYIDFVDFAALKNMLMSAKAKLMVRKGAIADIDSIADWEREIIEVDAAGGFDIGQSLKWFQSAPMSEQSIRQYAEKIGLLKDLTGQNAFTRGEGGSGVTAATAIMALQEAGNKITNMHRDELFDGENDLAYMQMELTREFYDESRVVRIRAAQNFEGGFEEETLKLTAIQWMAIREQKWPDGKKMHDPIQMDISVRIQKAVNFSTLQQNQVMLELYQLLAQAGVPVDPSEVIGLMTFDGKEAFLGAVRKGLMQQIMQLKQQVNDMATAAQNLEVENQSLRQAASGETPQAGAVAEPEVTKQLAPRVPTQPNTPDQRVHDRRQVVSRMRDQMGKTL